MGLGRTCMRGSGFEVGFRVSVLAWSLARGLYGSLSDSG